MHGFSAMAGLPACDRTGRALLLSAVGERCLAESATQLCPVCEQMDGNQLSGTLPSELANATQARVPL
jgi:hypothetical protein